MTAARFPEIAAHYRRQIVDGELKPGQKMPTMKDVAQEFDTSSNTVTKAYDLLKSEGLIVTKSGSGTLVAERRNVSVTGAGRLNRLKRTGSAYVPGETTTDRWVGTRSIDDPVIAERLGLEPHDEVVIRRRVVRQDGEPRSIGVSIIHMRVLGDVPELLSPDKLERLWHEWYTERTGRDVIRSPEARRARLASADELVTFGISLPSTVAAAVLVTVSVFHDEEGPIEVWEDVLPPGAWAEGEEA